MKAWVIKGHGSNPNRWLSEWALGYSTIKKMSTICRFEQPFTPHGGVHAQFFGNFHVVNLPSVGGLISYHAFIYFIIPVLPPFQRLHSLQKNLYLNGHAFYRPQPGHQYTIKGLYFLNTVPSTKHYISQFISRMLPIINSARNPGVNAPDPKTWTDV